MTDKILDCSDIDRYLGKPIEGARMKDPIGNLDIKRWAQAMHYPNRLHYDNAYAADSRFGKLIAPQSFSVACDDGHGAAPACVGRIPQSHLLFGGDEWWFYGPQIAGGDTIHNERIPFDYAVKDTRFAGPTCFQRGDNHYYNHLGDKIATQRSTSIRYRADLAREMGGTPPASATDDPEWTDVQLAELEDRKFEYIKMLHDLGHGKRWWDDVKVGDRLPVRVIGPHSIASFATEWRAYPFTIWGGMRRRTDIDLEELGFTADMAGKESDGELERINPEQTDGAYIGPSRGHLFPRWARYIGMPRGYGYGASMGAWIIDYLAGWAGEWGRVVHSNCAYRGPAFTGDITIFNASVVDKQKDDEGRHVVQVDFRMTSQTGATMSTAKAEIQLPVR
ncbi:MAG TPA: MaoC family dehydratase N-terminal domain-containing protein [Povalibacter sp.]|uniref:FAS1-like dehydratase domain-containing protein n=1 Tax=Povalibacter sp. TaxID=1962978 RepID=UPI002C93CF80|nr:MaoC family dehydratase N-terminal domain-containing protein [Povalibacter sp.]HMN43647.1 MaoC family dehydratase N-terminal domain-containing protein [Povalibacter sp.]